MALTPQNNEAFLREVDEELRRDNVTNFWRRYGLLVAAAVVLGLAALAGWMIWQQRQAAAAGREGEALAQAIDSLSKNNAAGARASLDALATSETPGYRAVAKLAQADVALQSGNRAGAAQIYQSVATDAGIGQPFRDVALVRATAAEFDRLPPATVIQRLRPLAQPGNPWFGSAGEMVAMAELAQGNGAAAARLFTAIANDAAVPQSIRSRAVQMAAVVDAGGQAPAAAAPTPAAAPQETAR
ncbi:hypothetical protein GGR88_000099 [Sphingomonas jejuensis]|uniref:Ancillary SecYEG translocon subunit/Cell division coordinator CpoB TPR domain-containing protein n=1 Tax=Sphingomonas jejuensis TaxID=904715 RepID=A0ABX0XHD6_9SPHN|nr:tetratricopeptide repeat protein [Sphingomonas jejuensis]NJC32625.1 hypothetical protein [Sphingomonas jejuensis]